MILLPPSPVSNKITVDIRIGLTNDTTELQNWTVSIFLNEVNPAKQLLTEQVELRPGEWYLMTMPYPTEQLLGKYHVYAKLELHETGETFILRRPLEVLDRPSRSIDRVDGAFAGFYHWSEKEGRLWNSELKKWKAEDWKQMMHAMHEIGMDLLLPQEAFRNQEYIGQHNIETEGYKGRAFYPSALFPGRMDIACDDPLEACLTAADELDMNVFLPVGMYAWFDYTEGSLEWHKKVAKELWERYGHHRSVYGFYVSEEAGGDLGSKPEERDSLVKFFKEFTAFCRTLAPERAVMMAPNCYSIDSGMAWYPEFLKNLDILCPFAFHRMPPMDHTGEEAATLLQDLCDKYGTHLWLDMEAFLFESDGALYPRPIEGLIEDFRRFPNFEKIVCYQFPGIFNAPEARIKPGGPATVKLYEDYKNYLKKNM